MSIKLSYLNMRNIKGKVNVSKMVEKEHLQVQQSMVTA